jgi:hypothetical protein
MFASLSRTLFVVNSTFEARTSREAEVLVLRVWRLDTAHHSFTFANAVHQAIQRAPSAELVRGAFDATMSVYLNRFLNVPAAKIPTINDAARTELRQCWSRCPHYLTVSSRWTRPARWSRDISRKVATARLIQHAQRVFAMIPGYSYELG